MSLLCRSSSGKVLELSWCANATDRGEIVKVIQLARCGADRGIMPQIMEKS